jgi:PKD repeat protein
VEVFNAISFNGSFGDPGSLDTTRSIVWDFGDGTGAEGTLTPAHTYSLVGQYTVTLRVTDDDGGVGTDILNVQVIQKYAIWANSPNATAIQWSGSGAQITGKVHSNGGISMSGSNNAINGTVYYVSKFTITGSSDHCTLSQQLPSVRPIPVHYDLSAYQPGGTAAQAAGKYQYINGNFSVSKSGTVLDGLYYVKGNVSLSGSNIKGTCTIVAEGTITISGSGMNSSAYSGDLLFFSNGTSLSISGSNSTLGGIIYAPNSQINISGSNDAIAGSLFGNKVAISGSNTKITVK